MTHIRSHLLAAFAVAGFFMSAPASAQSSACQEGQKILQERQNLVQQINKLTSGGKKKQIDPRSACTVFSKLVTNGNAGQKWMTDNKDWCQIPDQVVEGFTKDHQRSQEIKGQACQAAAKMAEMEKRAKQQAQKAQQGGIAGKMGGGLTGTLSIPKGAL
jgi:adenine-specific DNA methylase